MKDLSSLEQFNQYYSTGGFSPLPKSLLDFFRESVRERLPSEARILDLGCGARSIFEELSVDRQQVKAVDFSPVAIARASHLHSGISYEAVDITFPEAFGGQEYDLIFDSHCLHCIENKAARVSAFKNIYEALSANGFFAGEMMVRPAHRSVHFPMKYIPDARSLEEEILGHGFKIIYFMITRGLSFENGNEECDLLRVIAKK